MLSGARIVHVAVAALEGGATRLGVALVDEGVALREAVAALGWPVLVIEGVEADEGLVESKPQSHTRVTPLILQDVHDALEGQSSQGVCEHRRIESFSTEPVGGRIGGNESNTAPQLRWE